MKTPTLEKIIQKISVGLFTVALLAALPAMASDNVLRKTGISVFNYIYSAVGIVGAIALLIFAVNLKLNFIPNPLKAFMTTVGAMIVAFSVTALVQFLKDQFGSGPAIGTL